MEERPKITPAQWWFMTYYCGGNGHMSVGLRTQDSLEHCVARECKDAGLIKKKMECELVFELTELGKKALYLDVDSRKAPLEQLVIDKPGRIERLKVWFCNLIGWR
jgi:hypothetical protein